MTASYALPGRHQGETLCAHIIGDAVVGSNTATATDISRRRSSSSIESYAPISELPAAPLAWGRERNVPRVRLRGIVVDRSVATHFLVVASQDWPVGHDWLTGAVPLCWVFERVVVLFTCANAAPAMRALATKITTDACLPDRSFVSASLSAFCGAPE